MKLAEAWFHAAKILLSRFHFISNGSAPFRLNWGDAKKIEFAKLDGPEISFIQKTQEMMAAKGAFTILGMVVGAERRKNRSMMANIESCRFTACGFKGEVQI